MSLKRGIFVALVAAIVYRFATYKAPKASSVITLALQYLSRPHVIGTESPGYKFEKITSELAWNGSYMSLHPEIWADVLTLDEQKSVHHSVLEFEKRRLGMEDMKKEDFVFAPEILKKFDYWKRSLGPDGRGFQVIRNVPVQWWTMKQSEIFYWAFGKYIGIPGAQDSAGNLLGHVTDIGASNVTERPYRQKVDISYHCDGSDVVGLLCINGAKSGGESRIISSVTAYNKVLELPRGQEYIHRLFGKIMLFTRKTFGLASHFPVHPLHLDRHGVLRSYWNQEYYVKSYRHTNGSLTPFGEKDPFALEAVEAYDSILNADLRGQLPKEEELGLSMNLQQGDIQLVSNHFVLHARTEFTDYSDAEIAVARRGLPDSAVGPIGRRDLLRLWVSHDNSGMGWEDWLSKQVDFLRVVAGLSEGLLFYR